MKQSLLLLFFSFALACQTDAFKDFFGDFSNNSDELDDFNASDRIYFPDFVKAFFQSAEAFEKIYPSLNEARSEVRLVEVKALNKENQKFNEANLSWSSDGAFLGFEVIQNGYRKIMLKNLVGDFTREIKILPDNRNTFLDGMVVKSAHSYNAGLRWAKNSSSYAFMSNGGIGEYSIYVGAVGNSEKSVSSSKTKDGYATWSHDSKEIAFVSARTGGGDIYLLNMNAQKEKRLTRSESVDIFPEWFPDGQKIVYSNGDALKHNLQILIRRNKDSEFEEPMPFTNWDHDDLRPTVSPNGKLVAFYTSSNSDLSAGTRLWNIVVVPFEFKKVYLDKDLSNSIVAKDVVIDLNTGPAWSPDSRKIFYVKRDPAEFNPIYCYDLYLGRQYIFKTNTKLNRDILMSEVGILSFRAQEGVWDKVYLGLTNQGSQLQNINHLDSKIHYLR